MFLKDVQGHRGKLVKATRGGKLGRISGPLQGARIRKAGGLRVPPPSVVLRHKVCARSCALCKPKPMSRMPGHAVGRVKNERMPRHVEHRRIRERVLGFANQVPGFQRMRQLVWTWTRGKCAFRFSDSCLTSCARVSAVIPGRRPRAWATRQGCRLFNHACEWACDSLHCAPGRQVQRHR